MPTHRSARRRISRVALSAGLVAALGAAGPVPALAAPGAPSSPGPAKAADDKLGAHDADLLAQAKAGGDKSVTLMLATAPGAADKVADQLDSTGASAGKTVDKLGYLRVTVPTAKVDATLARANKLSSVHAIDLNEEIALPDPRPDAGSQGTQDRQKEESAAEAPAPELPNPGEPYLVKPEAKDKAGAEPRAPRRRGHGTTYPGPDRRTPAENPYQPAHETGAVDFVEDNPKADGRGVTIGILDSGVDIAHPALQKTTTGERKITDWVTATDPLLDGDGTWLPMLTAVSGPVFTVGGREYTAPEGSFHVNVFRESATLGGEMRGDLNRDGDTTDTWAVLYEQSSGKIRVDLNDDADFNDEEAMLPYKERKQVSAFGDDDPKTAISEEIPFVVEYRKDVDLSPVGGPWEGRSADFVSIGVVEGAHGTHVAGITAANGLFGGRMDGAAPGAKLVSSRACTWSGGCTNVALTEGMIDLVTKRGVDIVNMSIGGLPALNDGLNARTELYNRLIDTYDVQLVISAGNSGPGVNTIGDPAVAAKVISVGATVSKETWAANYGSIVKKRMQMMPFSSRGPREDGGFTPTISAPGASINSVPTWQPGQPVPEAGYDLPPGYGMLQGTSMASPQAAGATALLISAAKRSGTDWSPARLRTALTSSADRIKGVQAYEQGSGLLDVEGAWKLLRGGPSAHTYSVTAPVDSPLSQFLPTPHVGTGIYDRGTSVKAGKAKTYQVTVTRTSGPDRPVRHSLKLANNHDGNFRLGDDTAWLPLGTAVKIDVRVRPDKGVNSAILQLDDPRTRGVDQQVMATVVASDPLAGPSYTQADSGKVQRNSTTSHFVTVPEGAKALEVSMSGLADGSQTRWIAINPYGVPADPTSTPLCYPNYPNPANTCRPDLRSYDNPIPGVWELEVESRRTSPLLNNRYTVSAQALGVTFDPPVQTIEEAVPGTPAPVTWKVTNGFAPIDGKLRGGELGSAASSRPSIADGESKESTVTIGSGVSRLDVSIGSTSDTGADLDLFVLRDGAVVAQSADGDSEESVSLTDPAAGEYTIVVDGYSVPAGTTEYDYRDVYFSPDLGTVEVDESATYTLGNGESADVPAKVLVAGAAPEGRQFFGEVQVLNARGTVAGAGSVLIKQVAG